MEKVSVIIPVYNVENLLNRCLDSLIKQTFSNIEIIMIDDGSTDNSYKIMKEYSKKDSRFLSRTQKNSGPAIARNNGLNIATGKYVMFVDSDDYVDENYIEIYYNEIFNSNYDVIMGGYTKIIGNKIDFKRILNNKDFSKYVVPAPYAKIYKYSFLKQHKIEFLDTKSSEDVYFNMEVIYNGANIKCINNTGYYYYFNPISISNTSHKGFNSKVNIIELLDAINYKKMDNIELHRYFIIRYVIWYLLYSGKQSTSEKFNEYYEKYFDWLRINVKDFSKNKNLKMFGPKGEIPKIGFIIYVF